MTDTPANMRGRRIAFTATRDGLTAQQKRWCRINLAAVNNSLLVRHGDCVGGDEDIHQILLRLQLRGHNIRIELHPCNLRSQRAFCSGAQHVFNPRPPLVRNHDMVDLSKELWGFPKTSVEQQRGSGTWATIRYARKIGKPYTVVGPDGNVLEKMQRRNKR